MFFFISRLGYLKHMDQDSSSARASSLITTTTTTNPDLEWFVASPQPNTYVTLGQSVVLPCRIPERYQVQWERRGLIIAIEKQPTGWERVHVLGGDDPLIYDLKIDNVELDDQAVYSCQAVNVNVGGYDLKQSHTNLIVIVPPSHMEMEGMASRIQVKENQIVQLKCVVHSARPAAKIIWFRDNQRFVSDNIQESYIPDFNTSNDNRTSTISVVKFRPTANDDGISWDCQADHPALSLGAMKASVLLIVKHRPGEPVITGIDSEDSSNSVRIGETITLTCSSQGGNPMAQLTWSRNGQPIDSTYTTSGRESRNAFTFVVSGEDDGAVYGCDAHSEMLHGDPLHTEVQLSVRYGPSSLTLFGPREAEHNQLVHYTCKTSGSNPAASIVWVIDGVSRSGDSTRIIQLDNIRNGFSVGGHSWETHSNITLKMERRFPIRTIECTVPGQLPVEELRKSKTLMLISQPGRPEIYMDHNNETPVKQTLILSSNIPVKLKCVSFGGNPLPELHWTIRRPELLARSSHLPDLLTPTNHPPGLVVSKSNEYAMSELNFIPRPEDDNSILMCTANGGSDMTLKNDIRTHNTLTSSKSVNITVLFPPSRVILSTNQLSHVMSSGQNLTLVCETSRSKPVANIHWFIDDSPIDRQTNVEHIDDFLGGMRTISSISLSVTGRQHGNVVRCEASNGVVTQDGANKILVNDEIMLKVEHVPLFPNSLSLHEINTIQLIENTVAIVNLTVLPNPMVIRYTWTSLDTNLDLPRTFTINDGVLKIRNVSRTDTRTFRISASNELGKTEIMIAIDVLYSAKILDISEDVMVGQGETPFLECKVDANPMTNQTILWRRSVSDTDWMHYGEAMREAKGNDWQTRFAAENTAIQSTSDGKAKRLLETVGSPADVKRTSKVGVKLLTVLNVTAFDSGRYECVANNGIHAGGLNQDVTSNEHKKVGESVESTFLLVRHAPIMSTYPMYSKSGAEVKSKAVLICRARAVPKATFTWSKYVTHKNGSYARTERIYDNDRNEHFRIEEEALDEIQVVSKLTISSVSDEDYGAYECLARNTEGVSRKHVVKVQPLSSPDTPSAVWVTNTTSSGSIIHWIPPFNGGMDQYFRVRYSAVRDAETEEDSMDLYTKHLDVYPANMNKVSVDNLEDDTKYSVNVMAFNNLGESDYSQKSTIFVTRRSKQQDGKSSLLEGQDAIISGLPEDIMDNISVAVIIASALLGTLLCLVNALFAYFYCSKRSRTARANALSKLTQNVKITSSKSQNALGQTIQRNVTLRGEDGFQFHRTFDNKNYKASFDSIAHMNNASILGSNSFTNPQQPPFYISDGIVTGESFVGVNDGANLCHMNRAATFDRISFRNSGSFTSRNFNQQSNVPVPNNGMERSKTIGRNISMLWKLKPSVPNGGNTGNKWAKWNLGELSGGKKKSTTMAPTTTGRLSKSVSMPGQVKIVRRAVTGSSNTSDLTFPGTSPTTSTSTNACDSSSNGQIPSVETAFRPPQRQLELLEYPTSSTTSSSEGSSTSGGGTGSFCLYNNDSTSSANSNYSTTNEYKISNPNRRSGGGAKQISPPLIGGVANNQQHVFMEEFLESTSRFPNSASHYSLQPNNQIPSSSALLTQSSSSGQDNNCNTGILKYPLPMMPLSVATSENQMNYHVTSASFRNNQSSDQVVPRTKSRSTYLVDDQTFAKPNNNNPLSFIPGITEREGNAVEASTACSPYIHQAKPYFTSLADTGTTGSGGPVSPTADLGGFNSSIQILSPEHLRQEEIATCGGGGQLNDGAIMEVDEDGCEQSESVYAGELRRHTQQSSFNNQMSNNKSDSNNHVRPKHLSNECQSNSNCAVGNNNNSPINSSPLYANKSDVDRRGERRNNTFLNPIGCGGPIGLSSPLISNRSSMISPPPVPPSVIDGSSAFTAFHTGNLSSAACMTSGTPMTGHLV